MTFRIKSRLKSTWHAVIEMLPLEISLLFVGDSKLDRVFHCMLAIE